MPIRSVEWQNGRQVIVEKPMVCTARQARTAMLDTPYGTGTLLDAAIAAVAQSPRSVQIAWEYGSEWRRDDPNISAIAAALGLSEDQVDDLFIKAMQL